MCFRSLLRSVPVALGLAGVLCWTPAADAASSAQVARVSDELTALVTDEGVEAVLEIEKRVAAGLPPTALVALLDAARAAPRSDLAPTLQLLAGYRAAGIRARALLALAELGPSEAVAAVRAAANDRDRGVRRLALVLARLHPSDPAETLARTLLEEDETLASEERSDPGLGAPQVPVAQDLTDAGGDGEEILLIEEDDGESGTVEAGL